MFSRFRKSLGLALLLTLVTNAAAFAKGGFSFITVSGADLEDSIRVTDPALTESFFAFANFFEDRTDAPPNPGAEYEITRYYLDGTRETAFDRLHYYPESGFVYYDGIVNGSSEYDGDWYEANPDMKDVFTNALQAQFSLMGPSPNSQPANTIGQPGAQVRQDLVMVIVAILVGLVLTFALVYRSRRQARN